MLDNVYDTHESSQAELGARPEELSKARTRASILGRDGRHVGRHGW